MQWRIAPEGARQALDVERPERVLNYVFCSAFPPGVALLLNPDPGSTLAPECPPRAPFQQEKGIVGRQRTCGRAWTPPVESLERLLNLAAIKNHCADAGKDERETRNVEGIEWHVFPPDTILRRK